MKALDVFNHRVVAEWLPEFCNDPKRNYSTEGFCVKPNELSEKDAKDFMRAVDEEVVSVDAGGRFRMPQSKAFEAIFWDGGKTVTPRYISLWVEPVVTIAAMARLHFDHGWPLHCLGMQSKEFAFDIMAYHPTDNAQALIAGEVKATRRDMDDLMKRLHHCCTQGHHDCPAASRNAHKKWEGLHRHKAPLFWALGPGQNSRVFKVGHGSDSAIVLTEADNTLLNCPLS